MAPNCCWSHWGLFLCWDFKISSCFSTWAAILPTSHTRLQLSYLHAPCLWALFVAWFGVIVVQAFEKFGGNFNPQGRSLRKLCTSRGRRLCRRFWHSLQDYHYSEFALVMFTQSTPLNILYHHWRMYRKASSAGMYQNSQTAYIIIIILNKLCHFRSFECYI